MQHLGKLFARYIAIFFQRKKIKYWVFVTCYLFWLIVLMFNLNIFLPQKSTQKILMKLLMNEVSKYVLGLKLQILFFIYPIVFIWKIATTAKTWINCNVNLVH